MRQYPKVSTGGGGIPINAGVGASKSQVHFSSGLDGGSSFGNTGDNFAEVVTIDESCTVPPTFIKMDVEGFEIAALKGASETIRKHKPKLAICLYHKISDFVDVPKLVLSLRDDYKMYVRHYTPFFSETVAYFV
jgi:hypothetical protein